MAHAIHGYSGECKNIHGHSYELHVRVAQAEKEIDYIPAPGFVIDFRNLKKMVTSTVIEALDHKLVLSRDYLAENPEIHSQENLFILEAEPTVENLLIFIQRMLQAKIPPTIFLAELKLYETKSSYATWINSGN